MPRRIDQTIATWGVTSLIVLTPLALGSVEPWAFASMEAVIFLIVVSWLLWHFILAEAFELPREILPLALPAVLFVTLIAFEMAPLPPSIEKIISPSTFALYQKSLPGWPDGGVHNQPLAAVSSASLSLLPTSAEIAGGASVPFVTTVKQSVQLRTPALTEQGESERLWRSLSVDDSLTGPALLKVVAYLCLFASIVCYPSREKVQMRLVRMLLGAAIVVGLLTATVALLGRIFPNGKALWVFAPYDWPQGSPWGLRATGAFANPDHLADYLDLVLPFVLTGFLMPEAFVSRRFTAVRIFCGAAVILMGSALLLSSSRGGWLGALIEFAILAGLSLKRKRQHRIPHVAGMTSWGTLGLFLLLVLLVVGPGGRTQTDLRLGQTVAQDGLVNRLRPAKISLSMIRDFPVFGVGLGCWPEIFPHYAEPPWSPTFWNAMHNDYVQLAAETGLIGFGLAGWFFAATLIYVWRASKHIKPEHAVLAAGCVAAICGVGVHEFFDFSLQTPANALLFTVLLAIAVLLVRQKSPQSPVLCGPCTRILGATGLISAIGLIAAAVTQRMVPYPYSIKQPATVAEAYSLADAHPANSRVHLMLAGALDDVASHKDRMAALRSAVWLEPTNPFARDLYAQMLLQAGNKEEAFEEIRRSVLYSPTLASHAYLRARIIPWLSVAERRAVVNGFRAAIADGYAGAIQNFATYYEVVGKFSAEADIYRQAAMKEQSHMLRAGYLVDAGTAYAKAGDFEKAQVSFESAADVAPQDSNAYEQLVRQVLGPENSFAAAKAAVSRAIQKGADPFNLYLALGWAAQKSGNSSEAEAALQKALAIRPSSVEALVQMGEFELATNRSDRAADWLRRAIRVDPSSATAFYDLGLANEGAYEYFAAEADQAFQKALALAPWDERVKAHYAAFRQKATLSRPDIFTN